MRKPRSRRSLRGRGLSCRYRANRYRKFAVTDLSLVMVSVQVVAVPEQAPDQPIHGDPGPVWRSTLRLFHSRSCSVRIAVIVPLPFLEIVSLKSRQNHRRRHHHHRHPPQSRASE